MSFTREAFDLGLPHGQLRAYPVVDDSVLVIEQPEQREGGKHRCEPGVAGRPKHERVGRDGPQQRRDDLSPRRPTGPRRRSGWRSSVGRRSRPIRREFLTRGAFRIRSAAVIRFALRIRRRARRRLRLGLTHGVPFRIARPSRPPRPPPSTRRGRGAAGPSRPFPFDRDRVGKVPTGLRVRPR